MHFLTRTLYFPDVELADDDGLLAVGGDLSVDRLKLAYSQGIFPWFDSEDPILWWSPDPRMVLFPNEVYVSRSMRKVLTAKYFTITFNTNFESVIEHCRSVPRNGQRGTWITREMVEAYIALYHEGIAKSVEVWRGDKLVGGLYGLDLGHIFCGESMFSLESNASKTAFIALANRLCEQNYLLLDCQMHNDHLASLGAREIPRNEFIAILRSRQAFTKTNADL